jgi:hypothetical protein
VLTVSYDGAFIIKIITIIWYINIQVSCSSKACGHVDIQARPNVVFDIYFYLAGFTMFPHLPAPIKLFDNYIYIYAHS